MLLTNGQSLVNKLDEAEVIFMQNNIDICIIILARHGSIQTCLSMCWT